MDFTKYLVDMALEMGADHAVPFSIDDIVFDPELCLSACTDGDWG